MHWKPLPALRRATIGAAKDASRHGYPLPLRYARGFQPVAGLRKHRSVRERRAIARRRQSERRGFGVVHARCLRQAMGHRRYVRSRPAGQRKSAEAADFRRQGLSQRHCRVPPDLSPLHARKHRGRAACLHLDSVGRPRAGAGGGGARGALLYGGAGRDRSSLPGDHDAGCGGRACRRAGACRQGRPQGCHAQLRSAVPALARQIRHDARHGDDGKAGRHRRTRQHHDRDAGWRRLFGRRP